MKKTRQRSKIICFERDFSFIESRPTKAQEVTFEIYSISYTESVFLTKWFNWVQFVVRTCLRNDIPIFVGKQNGSKIARFAIRILQGICKIGFADIPIRIFFVNSNSSAEKLCNG